MKFGRTYQAVLEGQSGEQHFVGLPYTVRFRVASDGNPTCNVGTFFFYNLPQSVRADLVKDYSEISTYRRIVFQAGYETEPQLPIIFLGNIFFAFSYREGPDWITEIEALDGGFAVKNSVISVSVPSGTPFETIAKTIILAMEPYHVNLGEVFNLKNVGPSLRGGVVCGNAWDELIRRCLPANAQVFIRKESVYIMGQNDVLDGPGVITEISEETGMIGSPRRQDVMTVATMLFEPRLEIGAQVTLKAREPYAGDRTIYRIEHAGTISPSVCGDLITRATFYRNTVDVPGVAA